MKLILPIGYHIRKQQNIIRNKFEFHLSSHFPLPWITCAYTDFAGCKGNKEKENQKKIKSATEKNSGFIKLIDKKDNCN